MSTNNKLYVYRADFSLFAKQLGVSDGVLTGNFAVSTDGEAVVPMTLSTYGTSLINSSFLGCNTLSWASGYFAARTAATDSYDDDTMASKVDGGA